MRTGMRTGMGLLLVAAIGSACAKEEQASAASTSLGQFKPLVVGDTAPRYAAVTLAGDTVRIGGSAADPAAPVTLVNIWATWCTSCREEFADLEALRKQYESRGFRVVAVSVDQGSTELVRRFVDAQQVGFAVSHDRAGAIQRSYAALGLPTTYLLGRDGKITWALTGGIHVDTATVRKQIEATLH